MAEPKKVRIPIVRIKKGDSRKTIYAKVRKAFTAEDLARYCQVEEMFPIEKLLAEMRTISKEEARKRRQKKKG